MESEKCEGWEWVDPKKLPQPHFEASEKAIARYLCDTCY
jgi:8-oxo-dGTP diphosphatase